MGGRIAQWLECLGPDGKILALGSMVLTRFLALIVPTRSKPKRFSQ